MEREERRESASYTSNLRLYKFPDDTDCSGDRTVETTHEGCTSLIMQLILGGCLHIPV